MTQDPSQTQDPHGHPRYHTATLGDALAVLVTPTHPHFPACVSAPGSPMPAQPGTTYWL